MASNRSSWSPWLPEWQSTWERHILKPGVVRPCLRGGKERKEKLVCQFYTSTSLSKAAKYRPSFCFTWLPGGLSQEMHNNLKKKYKDRRKFFYLLSEHSIPPPPSSTTTTQIIIFVSFFCYCWQINFVIAVDSYSYSKQECNSKPNNWWLLQNKTSHP